MTTHHEPSRRAQEVALSGHHDERWILDVTYWGDGSGGAVWCVHRIEPDGQLRMLYMGESEFAREQAIYSKLAVVLSQLVVQIAARACQDPF